MSETVNPPESAPAYPSKPWIYLIPLFLMQAIPVTIVREVSPILFKDMGIENAEITRWAALIGLPWSLQMLLGPLVDLNATKRKWVLTSQWVIAFGLILAGFLQLGAKDGFTFSLLILGATAITSALCNIATDGFFLISSAKEKQAKLTAITTTCFRLGRLLCVFGLPFLVGILTSFDSLKIPKQDGIRYMLAPKTQQSEENKSFVFADTLEIISQRGKVTDAKTGLPVLTMSALQTGSAKIEYKEAELPVSPYSLQLENGELKVKTADGVKSLGFIAHQRSKPMPMPDAKTGEGVPTQTAWAIVLGGFGILYFIGTMVNQKLVPVVAMDAPAVPTGEVNPTQKNIAKALLLVLGGAAGYFFLNSFMRVLLHGAWLGLNSGNPEGPLKGWKLPADNLIIGFKTFESPVMVEVLQGGICLGILAFVFLAGRMLLKGSSEAQSYVEFFKQEKFGAILFFILFYRLPEAMVGSMSALFLKDPLTKGGLALGNVAIGSIAGLAGIGGLMVGGIFGGLFVAHVGLKRAFWYLIAMMNIPNLLYLWASIAKPGEGLIGFLIFFDQFGYGFGFAGYMVYIMWVAQRGKFTTSHYAICTGMGALCIATAGAFSGVLQANLGYTGFFIAVLFFTVPSALSLLFIPIEDRPKELELAKSLNPDTD